ncbi:MAG: hypothetical protein FWG71_05145 [Synergistaceae bacterium]|nr:hypothetical protein [Synergistaceae bacterium]
MKLTESAVLRYLGYGNAAAEGRVSLLIRQIAAELRECASPKHLFGIWDCRVDDSSLALGNITINSKRLAEHLKGCRRAVLLAATLGAGADSLLRRCGVRDMGKAAIAQAVCAAMIEAYCDQVESEILQKIEAGLCLTARFSPGYGDFDLSHQKDILRLLGCGKIGLALTDGYMLTPSKSVTAVIGLTKEKRAAEGKCGGCADKQCAYREI